MADNDEGRVESRLAAVGRGFSATPERIAKLQAQADALAKQRQGKPTRTFSKVLGAKPEPQLSRKAHFREQRKAALPKKGPKPSGRGLRIKQSIDAEFDGAQKEDIVLKG